MTWPNYFFRSWQHCPLHYSGRGEGWGEGGRSRIFLSPWVTYDLPSRFTCPQELARNTVKETVALHFFCIIVFHESTSTVIGPWGTSRNNVFFSRIREDIRARSLTFCVLSAESQIIFHSYPMFLNFSSKSRVVLVTHDWIKFKKTSKIVFRSSNRLRKSEILTFSCILKLSTG